ncbi:MAG: hydantoinase/oxoprolinase family protein [Desulfurococcaceae archaeon]
MGSNVVAVDVGGTFTDVVYVKEDGSIGCLKILTNPRKPELAIYKGLEMCGLKPRVLIHASTLATNLIRGQVGLEIPKIALITTRGFRDIIEIGRQNRPKLYDPFFEKPKPLVPREYRFEVTERIDYTGRIVEPLNLREVENIGVKLKDNGIESVAIVFLHSYINSIHEEMAGDIIKKYVKYVSLSSKVSSEPREYERTSTTVINALLKPVVSRYLSSLKKEVSPLGVEEIYIMSSVGGLIDIEEAVERPVQIIESGPAAGIVATAVFARELGLTRVVGFDMGGTTAKAGSVIDFNPTIVSEYEVGGEVHHGRVIKGSGYPIRFPFIDLAEVSAGGGTIIWRDYEGALHVGPMSAGSEPGPACYGLGGVNPTITDANLVLGRIGLKLANGLIILNYDLAEKSLSKLGNPVEVAYEALQLVNLEMARAVRLVTIERGLNPEEFVLIAYGGAGPQHAVFIAEEIGIKTVIIPPHPGLFSAMGLLLADWKFEARKAYPANLEDSFRELEEHLMNKVGDVDYFIRYADVRYVGQGWELTVPVGTPTDTFEVKRVFEEKHYSTFGFKLDRDIEITLIRVFAVKINKSKPKLGAVNKEPRRVERLETRKVFFDEWIETPVYNRDDLFVGFTIEGPAIIEEYSSCTVIPPGWVIEVGGIGELVLKRL